MTGPIEGLPDDLVDLLSRPSSCYVATTMPDGSPQLTQTWGDTDGRHVLINSVDGFVKVRNLRRDPRIAITVADPGRPSRYVGIRGEVISITADGAEEHIERLAQRYLGTPYPWYGGREQTRLILTIRVDRITRQG